MFLAPITNTRDEVDPQASIQPVEVEGNYGHFHIEPLRRGLAHTLGSPLRRVLLASLPGAAIATARVDGALHEFSTLEFMREDLVEFILNVKGVRLRSFQEEPASCSLEVEGPAEITAGDIELPSGVEIVNTDHHLASLTAKGTLRSEFTIECGSGYVGSEERSGLPIGVIPLDMIFSPVTKVEYSVEDAQVGRETVYDRLVIKIWTDGTTSPPDALRGAARKLSESFAMVAGVDETVDVEVTGLIPNKVEVISEALEELKLSNRALNCLRRHGVETVEEVAAMTEDDLYDLRGMGVRLVDEIQESLATRGLSLASGTLEPTEE